MNQFPKWKYHATLPALVVDNSTAEEDLGLGWHDTPAEALAAAAEEDTSADDAEEYRKELLTKAKALGLSIHHLTGAEKILAAIAAHEADQSA